MNAVTSTTGRVVLILTLAVVLLARSASASAQESASSAVPSTSRDVAATAGSGTGTPFDSLRSLRASGTNASRSVEVARFFLGAAAALGIHESGHVVFDGVFGVHPEVRTVHFGPIPFFAISHQSGLPPRQEFVISSAGFWMQHLSSEIVLVRHPRLRDERAPLLKGMLAFNVLASVAYGAAAMAHAGPAERDTRGMAGSLGVDERWVGAMVLAPALLDGWRYFHPDSRPAAWISRAVKVGLVVLAVAAR